MIVVVALGLVGAAVVVSRGLSPRRAPAQARLTTNPLVMTPTDLDTGLALYVENCARCHGIDGRANTREANQLSVRPLSLVVSGHERLSEGEIFWSISNGIGRAMPAFGDLSEKARWQITSYVQTLPNSRTSQPEQPVTVRFRASVNGEAFACGSSYRNVGSTRATISPQDFRFYAHDVRLVTANGVEEAVRLAKDDRFQDGEVALLDFEDGSRACLNGTAETRDVIVGSVRPGAYVGLRFRIGVPFTKNHADPLQQTAPLDLSQMFWVWNAGHKFIRLELKAGGNDFFLHLGSTGCTPDTSMQAAPTSCTHPNRPDVAFAEFDPENDVIEIDLARLLSGTDLTAREASCMGGPEDPACAPLFKNLGLPSGAGSQAPQTFLRRIAGAPAYAWDLPPGFPVPRVPKENPMTAAKVELGRFLFYDRRLSSDGTFSCASCHDPSLSFTDGKARAVGVTGQRHPRGSMSLANIAYSPVLTWANPNLRSLETQALVPMFSEQPVEMGLAGQERQLVNRLRGDAMYAKRFGEAFPEDAEPVTLLNLTRAIASFERTLISGRSPYDRYRFGGDASAISKEAKRGEAFFFSERLECFHCHGGFNFTQTQDYAARSAPEIEFHNTGLYNLGAAGDYPKPNTGVHEVSGRPEDMGRFKAPSLRNIAVTAPYMHDGSIATLDAVLDHYQKGGRTIASGPLAGVGAENPIKSPFVNGFPFPASDRAAVLAFLESLTDDAFLKDPRFADPWPKTAAAAAK